MSLPLFQPQDVYSRAAFNALVTQLNKGLFKSGSAVVDADGKTTTVPAGQVSGIPAQVVVVGNYIGNSVANRAIVLGFQASAVFIAEKSGVAGRYGGLTTADVASQDNAGTPTVYVRIYSYGFEMPDYTQANMSGILYKYVALR